MNWNNIDIIEHTGDIGIRFTASSREELFRSAAMTMVNLICPDAKILKKSKKMIAVSGDDNEQLLVNWLSEINFLFQTEQFLPAQISITEIKGMSLKAQICGDKITGQDVEIQNDIKAVTYHRISIRQMNGTWSGQVIFDV